MRLLIQGSKTHGLFENPNIMYIRKGRQLPNVRDNEKQIKMNTPSYNSSDGYNEASQGRSCDVDPSPVLETERPCRRVLVGGARSRAFDSTDDQVVPGDKIEDEGRYEHGPVKVAITRRKFDQRLYQDALERARRQDQLNRQAFLRDAQRGGWGNRDEQWNREEIADINVQQVQRDAGLYDIYGVMPRRGMWVYQPLHAEEPVPKQPAPAPPMDRFEFNQRVYYRMLQNIRNNLPRNDFLAPENNDDEDDGLDPGDREEYH